MKRLARPWTSRKQETPGQQTASPALVRYDATTIWLHWMTVGLIVVLWLIGQTADWVPKGPLRSGVWSLHYLLGIAAGMLLAARIVWRSRFGRVLPPADTGFLFVIAKLTHNFLLLLLAVVVALGVVNALYRGVNLFGLWSLPPIGAGAVITRESVGEWHELSANLIMVTAVFHALAALMHQYVWRDHLLERMAP